jgi:hypothetical protein
MKGGRVNANPPLVTRERERPSVPRSGNAVPGTGTRERFCSYSVKLHPKCRSSFLDPSFPFGRSGNSGDYEPTTVLQAPVVDTMANDRGAARQPSRGADAAQCSRKLGSRHRSTRRRNGGSAKGGPPK